MGRALQVLCQSWYGSLAGACRVCDTGSGVLDKRGGTGRDKTALKTRVTASSCAIAKTAKSLKLDSETAPPEPPRRAPQPCRKLSPTTPAKRTSKQLEIALGRNYRWSDIHSRLSAFMRQRPAAPRFIKLPAVSFHRAFISRHTVRTRSLSDDGVPVVGAAARLAWVVARAEHSLRLRNVNTHSSHTLSPSFTSKSQSTLLALRAFPSHAHPVRKGAGATV